MRGLINVVLLVIGINTILSLSLPVYEGDTYWQEKKNFICFSDDDDALDFPNLEMVPQFDFSDAGKEGLKDSLSQLCIPPLNKRECANMTQHFSKLIIKNKNFVSKTQIEE